MTPVQLFGVVVRSLGLLVTIYGIGAGLFGLLALLGADPAPAFIILAAAIALLTVGLWLLRGAKLLVAFAYPETAEAADRPPATP